MEFPQSKLQNYQFLWRDVPKYELVCFLIIEHVAVRNL